MLDILLIHARNLIFSLTRGYITYVAFSNGLIVKREFIRKVKVMCRNLTEGPKALDRLFPVLSYGAR